MKVTPELISTYKELPSGKKIYFASDFHLGAPNAIESQQRELKIIQWLEHIANDASAIFLLGDVFDFWFEYKKVIPKGFIRFQGKLAELKHRGVDVVLFSGNHDLWFKDYFPTELGIPVYHQPIVLEVGDKKLYIGHGDGLGPGDHFYKAMKLIFTNRFCQWMFRWLHPDLGIAMARFWSRKSREKALGQEESFMGEEEVLWQYSKSIEAEQHHDLYVFGHRHLSLELPVANHSTYFNLGEWVHSCSYLEFDGHQATLKDFNR